MKTRRIHLQPGECVEVVNSYGTSMLKAVALFSRDQPCVVVFEQPGVVVITLDDLKDGGFTDEPKFITPDLVEQFGDLNDLPTLDLTP